MRQWQREALGVIPSQRVRRWCPTRVLKYPPQLAASAHAFSVIITGKKDGQGRIDEKDLGGFDHLLAPIAAIGRYAISGI